MQQMFLPFTAIRNLNDKYCGIITKYYKSFLFLRILYNISYFGDNVQSEKARVLVFSQFFVLFSSYFCCVKLLAKFTQLCYYSIRLLKRRRVGMADEADSKSVVGNHVRVQVPLPA